MPLSLPTVPRQRAPEHADEWSLVDAAAAGDHEAFAQLYQRHQQQVARYLHSRCHSWSVAEDLTSVVFLRAYRTIARVEYQGLGYGAWLMRIASNVAIDHAKSAATKTTDPIGDWYDHEGLVAPDQPDVEVVRAQDAITIRGAMNRLTAEQRRVLELRFLAELSLAETAAVLGVAESVVKSRQYRACRALLHDPAIRALSPRRNP